MQLFRKLAGNVFFKIILAFVALTFVFFGISGFILGSPNSWVAKVGSTTIGINAFTKAMQNDRELVLAANKSEEALKYLDSNQFKSDVLGRMVNRAMIEKLHENFGVEASRDLILATVAKDPSFKNKEGKFDRDLFKQFLAKHGLNEEKYVGEIANDITATMIIQTMSMAAPLDENAIFEAEKFRQEKRIADVITITPKDIGTVAKPTEEEITKFYEENKKQYGAPEMRKVSYLYFSKKDFAKDFQISDAEILADYEKNKDQLLTADTRSFYHILFDKEEGAKNFLQRFEGEASKDSSKAKAEFAKLAKEIQNKDLKAIALNKITQKDFIPELLEPTFKLGLNEHSQILKSPLGFHVFLVTEINKPQPIPFAQAKASIKDKLLQGREDKVLQSKVSEIDDALLTSNSLVEVAKKFSLKTSSTPVKINQAGQNDKGLAVNEIIGLGNFAENAFALKKDQTSKILYAKNSSEFYALKVEEIEAAHDRDLSEIKSQISEDVMKHNKNNALQNLAKKIGEELKAAPDQALQIADKYKLKVEKNREFPRALQVNFQGRQVPYQNKFLEELFNLKIGQITTVLPGGTQEFIVGILRSIKPAEINAGQIEQAMRQDEETFRNEVLQEYNTFLLERNPVKVNDKILGKKSEEQ